MPRKAVSNDQRRALRRWFFSQKPRPKQRDAITWFFDQFGHRLTQSSISESLSDHYKFLDIAIDGPITTARNRQAHWPILEAILLDWHKFIEAQGGHITGDAILQKAAEIWPRIPQYADQPLPHFSTGWLTRFKHRHSIKKLTAHGESSSVPEIADEEMRAVRTLCGDYAESDIYNMDETGLYWRMTPTSSLATQPRPGVKRDKNRLSLVVCCNYDGTHKLPLWVIGKSQRPRCLKHTNLAALGCKWRANKKAWMTGSVMSEWLQHFYASVDPSRSVLLLLDNFPSHIAGSNLNPPPANVRILWLPANSTSLYQPLDQGIIANIKVYYRKALLSFMLRCYEQQIDPIKQISIDIAIRWCSEAWFTDVSPSTIYKCFRKARIMPGQEPITLPIDQAPDIGALYEQVREVGQIQAAMSLSNFLNPEDEALDGHGDGLEVDVDELIARHTQTEIAEEEDEEEAEKPPKPTSREVLQAIELIYRYKVEESTSTANELQFLTRLRRSTELEMVGQQQQSTLDRWMRE